MPRRQTSRVRLAGFVSAGLASLTVIVSPAPAVIVMGGEGRNLAAPTGDLLMPWDLQVHVFGPFVNYNATPISPSQVIIAAHTAAGVGSTIQYNSPTHGASVYEIDSVTNIPNSDLRILNIKTYGGTVALPAYASLWSPTADGSEVGRPMAVFGRGTQRGAAIYAPLTTTPALTPVTPQSSVVLAAGVPATPSPTPTRPGELRGWFTGQDDRLPSWGTNVVDGAVTFDHRNTPTGPVIVDNYALAYGFTAGAGPNEAAVSGGDSGGGMFVLADDHTWKLAGVNYGTDGNYGYAAGGRFATASVFDARGLYLGVTNPVTGVSTPFGSYDYDPQAIENLSYSTRVGAYYSQLQNLIGASSVIGGGSIVVPEPGTMLLAATSVATLKRRRRPL